MPKFAQINLSLWQFIGRSQETGYLKLVVFLVGVFILFSLFTFVLRHLLKTSARGLLSGLALGIILMIILDLVIIIGLADEKAVKQFREGEKRKQTTQEILISGFSNLGQILGVSTIASKKPKNAQEVLNQIFLLPDNEVTQVKTFLCP